MFEYILHREVRKNQTNFEKSIMVRAQIALKGS